MRLAVRPSMTGPRLCTVVGGDCIDLAAGYAYWLVTEYAFDRTTAVQQANRRIPQDVAVFVGLESNGVTLANDVAQYVASRDQSRLDDLRAQAIVVSCEGAEFLPPIGRDARIFCVGRNYGKHIAETGGTQDDYPALFIRLHSSFVGHNQTIMRPYESPRLDWEGELACIIGTPGRRIPRTEAMAHVYGYTIVDEGSVRDFQQRARHITAGKNFDRSGSMGPWIVTSDEIADPMQLAIKTVVSGETMQDGNTEEMIFDIAMLIEEISLFTYLQPGDIISTGTPAGVGSQMNPKRYLHAGDIAEFSIEGIGTLRNEVDEETA